MALRLHTGIVLTAIAALWLGCGSPALGAKDLAAEKAKQAALAKEAKQIEKEIGGIKSKLVETSSRLRRAERNLSVTEEKLKDLNVQEEKYSAELKENRRILGGLVSGARKHASMATPLFMLQKNPADAARAALVIKTMIPEINTRTAEVRVQLEEIGRIKAGIVETQAEQVEILSKYNDEKGKLDTLVQKRQSIYDKTEDSRKKQETAVARLAKEAKTLEELVSHMKPPRPPASRNRGDKKTQTAVYRLPDGMPMPVYGKVRTGFNEKDDLGARSKGLTFNTRSGAQVVTPLAGVVKFAGPFQKHRQILIIEHRGGYHSLLAGLGRIDTVVGASLDAGEPVGAADEKGADAQVYYELRHNGEPVNPKKLLATAAAKTG